jgi:integrase
VYRAFREACDALKLVGETGEQFTIHSLRATFATLSILEGRALGWVVTMLGHKNENTLRRFYYKWIRVTEENPLAGVKW